jgi:hypothetical protein
LTSRKAKKVVKPSSSEVEQYAEYGDSANTRTGRKGCQGNFNFNECGSAGLYVRGLDHRETANGSESRESW